MVDQLAEIQATVLDRLPTNVATLRDLYGLTNKQLGEMLGRNRSWANGRLARQTPFTLAETASIAGLFDVPVDLLLADRRELLRHIAERPADPPLVEEARSRCFLEEVYV